MNPDLSGRIITAAWKFAKISIFHYCACKLPRRWRDQTNKLVTFHMLISLRNFQKAEIKIDLGSGLRIVGVSARRGDFETE